MGPRRRRHLGITLALGAVGVLAYAWVARRGALGHIAWVVDLQDTANPLYRAWSAALPDYLDVTAATWVLHWTWAAALVALAVLAARDGFHGLDLSRDQPVSSGCPRRAQVPRRRPRRG